MSAQYGFAYHTGVAAGEAGKAAAVASAANTALVTGLAIGAIVPIAIIGWFGFCGAVGDAIGAALAGDHK